MKLLSFKSTSNHLGLYISLSLLWVVTECTAISSPSTMVTATVTSAPNATNQPRDTSSSEPTPSTTKPPPKNAEDFGPVGQTETSITLQWKQVARVSHYILRFEGREENIPAPAETYTVHHLTSATRYNFSLFAVSDTVSSSGVTIPAVTAPKNAEDFGPDGQNETSITLQWKQVDRASHYILRFEGREENIPAPAETYTVHHLTSATRYNFSLFAVFDTVSSSGVTIPAVTAPKNAEDFGPDGQNETSITLQWKQVDRASHYILRFEGREENIPAPAETYTVHHLTSATRYNFSLFAVSDTVSSSGVTIPAVTAPKNAEDFRPVGQNETSITLQWKQVARVSHYILRFEGREENIPAPAETYTVHHLTSATRYNFSLFAVFDTVSSSGVTIPAVTAPKNAEDFGPVGQNETSITLQWKQVARVSHYILRFEGREENIPAPAETYRVHHLTSATRYNFSLFTVSDTVSSSGVTIPAVTAPKNAEDFRPVGQNETSITLKWKQVDRASHYILRFEGREENIPAPAETYTVHHPTSATKYYFSLFTVFDTVSSSGVTIPAVTAPKNAEDFRPVGQNETSITLKWKQVDRASHYILRFEGREENIPAPAETYRVHHLTSATRYNFSLFTVSDTVSSSGVTITAVTAPENAEDFGPVGQNETSITLQWTQVDRASHYILRFEGREENIPAPAETYRVHHLTSATRYNFSLFTVFDTVSSSGVTITAVTAPKNAEDFRPVGQNETSITLQWKQVARVSHYTLSFNEREENIPAPAETYTVHHLTSATRYNFSLFTVFDTVSSSGVTIPAVTAPKNAEDFGPDGQTETSITLKWKQVARVSHYILRFEGREENIPAPAETYRVHHLTSATRYNFSLFAVFDTVSSSGVTIPAVTVPSPVPSVNVTERCLTNVTLKWNNQKKDLEYTLQIKQNNVLTEEKRSSDTVSYLVSNLNPGTIYEFSLITRFHGFNSTPYTDFFVTPIDCASGNWLVTNSSIKGLIHGVFSNATASNGSQVHISPNLSFTGLYPGATYEVSLEYELNSTSFPQCQHKLTVLPPNLKAHCENWAGGYSARIVWTIPNGVWTTVEVSTTGKNSSINGNVNHHIISGLQPAKRYKVSLSLLSGSERSADPFEFFCLTDRRGVIAGSLFGVLLFGVLVCVVVLFFLKKTDIIRRKKSFTGGSKLPNPKEKDVSAAKFQDHFNQLSLDENRGFSAEYEAFNSVGKDQTHRIATLADNKAKNRFTNVLPYDWCRVKLITSTPSETLDYINASYMPGYNSNREYIATQGPLSSTVSDFWRMIWEQRVTAIVMVTNCTEGGRTKCEQYWPDDRKQCLCGGLLVTTTSQQKESSWTLREFSVKHENTSEERTVKHFHFTAWPDHGVPEDTGILIQFRQLIRQHIKSEGTKAPTVVHCSAGVGRTGTIIALDVLLQQLEKERAVGIKAFVHKMRLHRPHMVQTESQYVFLHQCIMDTLSSDEKKEENIYENADVIYVNATALRELR